MKCQECNKAAAVKDFSDAYETIKVCQPCFDKLDFEEWSYGVDKVFGSQEESRREFKNGLITFSIIAVVIITIGFFLGG